MRPLSREQVLPDSPRRFKVIDGGGKPRPYRARKKGEAQLLLCPRCNSNASETVILGRMIRDGKPEGGSKRIRCADCKTPLI